MAGRPAGTAAKKTAAPGKQEKITAKTYSEEEVKKMVEKAVEEAVKNAVDTIQPTKIYRTADDEMVTVFFIAEVSPENTLLIPGYGSLRPHSYLEIPKKEFGGQFMSNLVRKLIEKRHLIVADGLTPDERVRWNCDYKEGEVLDEYAFDHLLDFDTEKLMDIFKKLCEEHKRFICRRMITAYEKGDNRLNLEKVRALNDISKQFDPEGMLKPILKAYSETIS